MTTITINSTKYITVSETEKGILIAPINKRTGEALKASNVIIDKATGNAYSLTSKKMIGTIK